MRPITAVWASFIASPSNVVVAPAIAHQQPTATAQQDTQPMPAPPATGPAPNAALGGRDAHAHTNRLVKETSPYLLQHAHNPVDWYPWGPEAFEAARAANKPIFLSIGYSTCYWCHVMERESFESEAIAAIMNEHFICIKVDREERPDVDDIYMAAVQLMSGGAGGWPMSVFLEPAELRPFLAGTYFPPQDNFGRPGFPSVLKHVASAWNDQRELVMQQAADVADAVKEHLSKSVQPVPVGQKHVEKAIASLLAGYDKQDGGFVSPAQKAPKFPTPVNLDFLIGAAWDLKPARDAVLHTLDRMAMGGMYDQVGGGFHRYSTDEKWLVPHFEKMLYDNGQLVSTYARAYELTRDEYYAEVVRETLDYVLREMTFPEGAFFSAQDAEVNTREGENYLWTESEVREALTAAGGEVKDDVDFAVLMYGLNEGTNFRDPHHPEDTPKNVLFLADKPENLARKSAMSPADFNAKLQKINRALLEARSKRDQPGTDDKVLAGWNGLMIAGMADGGRVLNDKRYKDAAAKAAQFVLRAMKADDGGLLRSHRAGKAKIDAFLEDYALMIRGLLALHKATGDGRVLEDAKRLAAVARAKFYDDSAGGYFDTLEAQSDLFVRVKSSYDGAIPCGNSVMLLNLLDLHEITGHVTYLDDASATLKAASSSIAEHPTGSLLSTLALDRFVKKYPQRLDPSQVAPKTGGAGGAAFGAKGPPVQIASSPAEVQVKPGAAASFEIRLTINKPWHITSNKPGDEFLIPLQVKLTGCDGLNMSVQYPEGEKYTGEALEGTVFVHHGVVTIPVRIEQTGKFSGRPQVTLTYQACDDRQCLDPKTEIVGIRIIAQR